jgi:prepilin-type N-terminal cleavage/methylation domain-containing protein
MKSGLDKHERVQKMKTRFTLIELLVVITIVAILSSIVLVAVKSSMAQSRKTYCVNNLKQIGLFLAQYANDYDGRLPIAYRIGETVEEPYVEYPLDSIPNILDPGNRNIFKCPSDISPDYEGKTFFDAHGTSYEWDPWFNGRKIESINVELAGQKYLMPIMLDAEKFHGKLGKNFLYSDGRVTRQKDPVK